MTAGLVSYARISARGIVQGGASVGASLWREASWPELGAPAGEGLPALKGRYFSATPSPRFGRMDELCKLALAAAELCLAGVGLPRPDEVALVGGSMLGCLEVDGQYHDTLLKGGPQGASPALFVYTLPSMFLGEIAIRFGLRGRTSLIGTGVTSALAALANAVRLVERGRAPRALAVGVEAVGAFAGELDLHVRGTSGASAWLLSAEDGGLARMGDVRYGDAAGRTLAAGPEGYGLTYVDALEQALRERHVGRVVCGEGMHAVSLALE